MGAQIGFEPGRVEPLIRPLRDQFSGDKCLLWQGHVPNLGGRRENPTAYGVI
jgi:hypothetical protein